MKNIVIIVFAIFMCSCGKKYTYTCTTHSDTVLETVELEMTEREARRYERKHSCNSDGIEYHVAPGEEETQCDKK